MSKSIKQKNKRQKKFSKSSNYNDFVEYQIARNKAVKTVRKAELQFGKKLAKQVKDDPKSFFAYVRSKSKTKDKVGPLNDNNKLCNFVIAKDKVSNKLGQIKENKAPGPDRLSPKNY